MDGKEVTAEKTFTAEKANGTVELRYAFDSKKLEGKTVVVFEDLYHQGIKVTTHSDINDYGQSVKYPKPLFSEDAPQTGDHSNLWVFVIIMAAACTAIMALSKKKKADDGAETGNDNKEE